MQRLEQFMQRLGSVHAAASLSHAAPSEVVAQGVFKGNPNVLLAKHVPPACEHLLLNLEVLLWACSRMVPEVAQALKQRGISLPSKSSAAGSYHRWTDGLLAGSAYICQIVHDLVWFSSWSALAWFV
jgi:hypothetical protein